MEPSHSLVSVSPTSRQIFRADATCRILRKVVNCRQWSRTLLHLSRVDHSQKLINVIRTPSLKRPLLISPFFVFSAIVVSSQQFQFEQEIITASQQGHAFRFFSAEVAIAESQLQHDQLPELRSWNGISKPNSAVKELQL